MKFFLSCLKTAFSRRIRRPGSWIGILLIPALLLGARHILPPQEMTAPVQVGVVLPASGGEALWQLLDNRSDAVVRFLPTDKESLTRAVAAGQFDCGLIAAEDFAQRVQKMDTDGIFTLYIAEGSSVYPLVQESVAACMAQLIKGTVARQYLEEKGIPYPAESTLIEANLVQIRMQTLDGSPLPALSLATSQQQSLLCWVLCGGLLTQVLLLGYAYGEKSLQSSLHRMILMRGYTVPLGGMLLGELIPILLSGWIGAVILDLGASGYAGVFIYVFIMGGCALLLTRKRVLLESIPVLTPFALLISLLLSGALVDLPLSRYFPASLFLRSCDGAWLPVALMAVFAAVLWLISLLLDRKNNRTAA